MTNWVCRFVCFSVIESWRYEVTVSGNSIQNKTCEEAVSSVDPGTLQLLASVDLMTLSSPYCQYNWKLYSFMGWISFNSIDIYSSLGFIIIKGMIDPSTIGSQNIGPTSYLFLMPFTFTRYITRSPSPNLKKIVCFSFPRISGTMVTLIVFFQPGSNTKCFGCSLISIVIDSEYTASTTKFQLLASGFQIVTCQVIGTQRGLSLKSRTFGSMSMTKFQFHK